jgi:hypothetical protein
MNRMRKLLNYCFVFILLNLFTPVQNFAQKAKSAEKQQKEFLKNEEDTKKKTEKQHKKDLKNHQKLQGKSTRKRMKQDAKKSERIRANRKEPFLKRLFTKKK